jgi:hypothetical protein
MTAEILALQGLQRGAILLHTARPSRRKLARRKAMKAKWAAIFVTAVLTAVPLVYGQDAGTTDANKSSGGDVKSATKTAAKDTAKGAKTVGKDTEKGTKVAAKDTEKGTKVAAKDTGKGAKVVGKDTEKGAKVAAKDTGKAAEKTGSAVKKVVDPKKKTDDTKPADPMK